jgi:hypothetical protein
MYLDQIFRTSSQIAFIFSLKKSGGRKKQLARNLKAPLAIKP